MTNEILKALNEIPLLDVHTHMDASHLSARGLHDVLLYHMVISDLYSAGCPDGARMPEYPTEEEVESRIEHALPYVQYIQNTSCFWGVRRILKDLYDWEKPITKENWREIHEIIKKKNEDANWPREIMKRANIKRIGTELWRGKDGSADDIFQYSVEWAFFTRRQWRQNDTALVELENAWGQKEPGEPLPVTIGEAGIETLKKIVTLEDVHEAIRHYCERTPYDKIMGIASHFSTDIRYRSVTEDEMAKALKNRANATEMERDIYASYVQDRYLAELEKMNVRQPMMQFSVGGEPLPYEMGSKLRSETVYDFADMAVKHPNLKFGVFLSSEHQNQAFCTVCREIPNISMIGYWWFNFFPNVIQKVMAQRLDMIAANNQIGFFSDAYCMDWAYAKSVIVKAQLAKVLEEKIVMGQYTFDQAIGIARQILFETPQSLLGIGPNV